MTFHLLGLSGSLREGSHNSAILLTLAENLAGRANLAMHRLNDVPLYNGDHDAPAPIPAPVVALRSAVAQADGVIVASPEYNYGMSGVIKNALDWLSRPYGEAALAGKPVLIMTSSMATTGGARAQAQLNETLLAIGAHLVVRPQIVIATAHEKISEGRLIERGTIDFALGGIDDLLRQIERERRLRD